MPTAARARRAATDPPTAGREGAEGSAREPGDLPPTEAHKPSWKGVGSCSHLVVSPPATAASARALAACAALALRAAGARRRTVIGDRAGGGDRRDDARRPTVGSDDHRTRRRRRQRSNTPAPARARSARCSSPPAGNWSGQWSRRIRAVRDRSDRRREPPVRTERLRTTSGRCGWTTSEAEAGACEAELARGRPTCCSCPCFGPACPSASTRPLLELEAPVGGQRRRSGHGDA